MHSMGECDLSGFVKKSAQLSTVPTNPYTQDAIFHEPHREGQGTCHAVAA